jgi:hypothetical protein
VTGAVVEDAASRAAGLAALRAALAPEGHGGEITTDWLGD